MKKSSSVVFGVLMCNHNRAEFLEEAIKSVFNQSYIHWKLYLLDDGSTDSSEKIIAKYANHPQIIYLKNRVNKGVGYSKKALIENSTEEIVGFLDSDDVLEPTAIEKCVTKHLNHPSASLVYTNHWICDENLMPLRKGDSRKIPKGESHATYFGISLFATFKRVCLEKVTGIRENLPKAVDQDIYMQLEEVGNLVFINECLYFYRHNKSSISLNDNYKKAGKYRIDLLRETKLRRKNTATPYPSDLWIDFRERELDYPNKNWFLVLFPRSFKHFFEVSNYLLYQVKVLVKRYILC